MAALADILRSAAARLSNALELESREARLEVQILAAHALGVNRAWLLAHDRDELPPAATTAVDALVAKREKGEPVAYILGEKEFYGRTFRVTPDVLIPRPETELLVETALERLPQDRPARVLDLGTGSACIAISIGLARPDSDVLAVDISEAALETARDNARRLSVRNIRFQASNWFGALDVKDFDMIVANPPYVAENDPHMVQGDLRFEPRGALASGLDGLLDLSRIIADAPEYLRKDGILLVEHGYDQMEACARLFLSCGFSNVECIPDYAGVGRISLGYKVGQ